MPTFGLPIANDGLVVVPARKVTLPFKLPMTLPVKVPVILEALVVSMEQLGAAFDRFPQAGWAELNRPLVASPVSHWFVTGA